MDKKKLLVSVFMIIFLISLINLVSSVNAQSFGEQDFRNAWSTISEWTKGIFGPFFEIVLGTDQIDEFFWAKVLVLIMIFAFINIILRSVDLFEGRGGIVVLISAIVSILGVRFIQQGDFINGILLPYNGVAIAISVYIPLLIYFYFVERTISSGTGRRFAWLLFAVVFIVLWINRKDQISQQLNWIYLIGLVLLGIFILFDSAIHKYFELTALHRWRDNARIVELSKLESQLDKVDENTPNGKLAAKILKGKIGKLTRSSGSSGWGG